MINANTIRLRACRKRCGLDQAELAELLGCNFHSLSRCERGLFLPNSEILLTYEIVFDIPASKLLPDTTARLRRITYRKAERLLKRCHASEGRSASVKVDFLEKLCHRLEQPSP